MQGSTSENTKYYCFPATLLIPLLLETESSQIYIESNPGRIMDITIDSGDGATHCETIYEEYILPHAIFRLCSTLTMVSGYYGELTVTGDLAQRWACWFVPMGLACYIVY